MQEVQRPLLTVDECLRMPGPKECRRSDPERGDMVVYVAGFPAIYGKQPLFFQDEIFSLRASVLSQNYRPYSRRSCCEY